MRAMVVAIPHMRIAKNITFNRGVKDMEQIIDIAKQGLDTYKAELYSLLYLDPKIEKSDLIEAVRNMRKLSDEIENLMEEL